MTTIGVILNKLMLSKCMSVDVISFTDFELSASSYSIATIVLQLDNDSYLFLDALKLFSEQPISLSTDDVTNHVTTWYEFDQYISNLEPDILQKYYTVSIVPRSWEKEPGKFELTPFFSNIGTQLRIRSVENTFGIDVEYCDHNNFYERRNFGKSWNYPDISIINSGAGDSINLRNSIPIINGSVFYPEVRTNIETGNEELIAHEAGKWLIKGDWNQSNVRTVKHTKLPAVTEIQSSTDSSVKYIKSSGTIFDVYPGGDPPMESSYCYNKNIMLVDFSPLGNISIIKLSDCTNGKIEHDYPNIDPNPGIDPIPNIKDKKQNIHIAYIKGNEYYPLRYPKCSYYEISFDLPVGTEMGIPIVCICGRLFYLHDDTEIKVSDDKISLTVKIDEGLLKNILLSNLQWFGKQNENTGFVEERIQYTLDEMFKDSEHIGDSAESIASMLYEDHSVPFVIMLHTDKKLVCTKCEPIMTLGPDKFLFPHSVGGILVNKRTREIVDYVRQFYASGTLIETAMLRPINFMNKDIKQLMSNSLAFEFNNYKSSSKYKKFDVFEEGRDLDEYMLLDFAYTEN